MRHNSTETFPPHKTRGQGQSWDPVLARTRLARCYIDKSAFQPQVLHHQKFCFTYFLLA